MTTKRDFLRLPDLSLADARAIFEATRTLKHEPKGRRTELLRGRSVAIVLEKASTRTRVSFEVGVAQLGGQPVVLGVQGSQLGRGEPLKDTARVLSRYCDAIVFRTAATARLEEMTKFASCPVINALSDDGHPVQVLCDVFTVEEACGRPITGKTVAFVGDCSSNMARSWVEAATLFDFPLVLAGPEDFMPPKDELARAGSRVTLRHDPKTALAGVEIVNTDVWASMGQEDAAEARVNALGSWTVDDAMLAKSDASSIVLHCLPAHRGEEISASVLEGARSRVWDQAENRLHVQKGLLLWLLGIKLD
jgi:ornithine carbamoyltransferase